MLFETSTSVYSLTIDNGEFVMKKLAIKNGASSKVRVGEESRGKSLSLNSFGEIEMGIGDCKTSKVITF
jgi:hypothetical protein